MKLFLVWVSIFSGRLCWCLRTYALWNRPRWLILLGVPAILAEGIVILTGIMRVINLPVMIGLPKVCMAYPWTGSWSVVAWIVPFSFDTALSLLSIVRAMRVSRKLKTPLTTQLLRDGARTYFSVTATLSNHLAGFGYYGCAPLQNRCFQAHSFAA